MLICNKQSPPQATRSVLISHFLSHQSDTSLRCQIMDIRLVHRTVCQCLFMAQREMDRISHSAYCYTFLHTVKLLLEAPSFY